ncbi:Similar to hypothetical protein TRIVIDRAFT_191998 [Trichoderma virens Gv29-8]; acc. no. EHK21704 [Pyronema omphalodes CBS 100304]|uniref:Uncharacterized protein n=1 Tax=Pyronema omphalodes (strain CBS 100304) TaxID=1076935 RepID=U4LNM9_PYROM|nr:Similar to hypothetical protein TRIVIDRAFT_191998 [Trichoderma virens Gv29-8]; acc. no. EHK21704 [Pyronema omphalodes CBS 100304]
MLSSIAAAQGESTEEDTIVFVNITHTDTTVGRMTFAAEPRGRGTVGILLSCTITFAFCIWTVVHPNVVADSTVWSRILYKAILMVIAVINPEGVVISAYGQWRDARRLNKEIEKYFEKLPVADGSFETAKKLRKKRREWLGMNGAFFVVMGGFVIDTSKCTSWENVASETMKKLVNVKQRKKDSRFTATLTPAGFIRYLQEGYFDFDDPPFQRTQIADKGKASNIAKVLSASQAAWLLLQSAARWAAGLKLSLLEIHIIIQVLCTALIFYFWWHKPLDVNEPISIVLKKKVGEEEKIFRPIKEIEDYHGLETASAVLLDMEGVDIGREPAPEYIDEVQDEESAIETPAQPVDTTAQPIQETLHPSRGAHDSSSDTHVPSLDTRQSLIDIPKPPLREPAPFHLKNWRTIHPLRRPYTITREPSMTGIKARALHDIIFYITGGTITKDSTAPPGKRSGSTRRMFIEGAFIGIIAGLHALAWNVYFPTEYERMAWRFSCIGMFAFPLLPIVVASMVSYHDDLAKLLWWLHLAQYKRWEWTVHQLLCIYEIADAQRKNSKTGKKGKGRLILNLHIVLIVFVLLMLLGYLVCITLITVESYASIRDPPKTTFITPRWSDYWPHI